MAPGRLSRDDWIGAALRAIAAGGIAAVSVERLATELGATKGSFYWHFKDRPALIEDALAEWERRDTDDVITAASLVEDPRERLRQLFRSVFDEGSRTQIDATLLADADNPTVATALCRVASKRLRYIDESFQALGATAGSDRALLAFTAFVGLTQLRRTAAELVPHGRRSKSYVHNVIELLLEESPGPK